MKKFIRCFCTLLITFGAIRLAAAENNSISFMLSIANGTQERLYVETMRDQTISVESNGQHEDKKDKVAAHEIKSWPLNKGARISVSIKDEQKRTLLLLSVGRGVFDLEEAAAVSRLIDYTDPLYNVFVRTTDNKHQLLSSWRLKEDKRVVYPSQVKLLIEFYLEKNSKVPHVRQSLNATSLPVIEDRVKPHVEPIKDSFFK